MARSGAKWRGGWRAIAALLAPTIMLCACSTIESDTQPVRAGLACVDDSSACIAERGRTLKAMVSDPGKSFVREQPTAAAYASGVRLFAFKTRKGELTCEELEIGRREADAAGPVLRGPQGGGLSQAQIGRGAMLGTEVSRELVNEQRRRCKPKV